MTWKELYGLALTNGHAATQELLRHCICAVERSSRRPALKATLGDTRMAGLYVLCDGLDAHGEQVPLDVAMAMKSRPLRTP
jgi:hypothetical protein